MKLLNEIVNSKIRIIQETQSNSLKKSNALSKIKANILKIIILDSSVLKLLLALQNPAKYRYHLSPMIRIPFILVWLEMCCLN